MALSLLIISMDYPLIFWIMPDMQTHSIQMRSRMDVKSYFNKGIKPMGRVRASRIMWLVVVFAVIIFFASSEV
jgi:hypothetical protein